MFETKERKERVILVGVSVSDYDDVSSSLDELEDLAETAGAVCVEEGTDPSHFLSGKRQDHGA